MNKKLQKSNRPQQKRAITTKNNIMKAAKKLFAVKGYHGTNSKEIAQKATVSIGAFYSHFKDKKVLLLEVLKAHIEHFLIKAFEQEKVGFFDNIDKKQIIENHIERIVNAYDDSPDFHRETLVLRYSDPDVKEIYDTVKAIELKYTSRILNLLGVESSTKNFETAVLIIHGAVEKAAHSIQLSGSKIEKDLVIKELSEMIFAYLYNTKELTNDNDT